MARQGNLVGGKGPREQAKESDTTIPLLEVLQKPQPKEP